MSDSIQHPWLAWLQAKQDRDWIERLEQLVLKYNNQKDISDNIKNNPFFTYLLLLPYESQVIASIAQYRTENEKAHAYNLIVNTLWGDTGGIAVDHHFKRRAAFHAFGYFIVCLLMVGTSATNSSAMYNFLTGDDVGLDFDAYENIVKAFLFVSSMMAQWMMYRKAVPEMINKVFSCPNGTWGFLETRSLEFALDLENYSNNVPPKASLQYKTENIKTDFKLHLDEVNESTDDDGVISKTFIIPIENTVLLELLAVENNTIKPADFSLTKRDANDDYILSIPIAALEITNGTFSINKTTYSYEYDEKNKRLHCASVMKANRLDNESDLEDIYIDETTARNYGILDAQNKLKREDLQIQIGHMKYNVIKDNERGGVTFQIDLAKLPGHSDRRFMMRVLTVCTVVMVASLGMLVLEKVASLLHKDQEKDGLFGLSEDASFRMGVFFGILIALGVGLLWKRVLNERFLEKEQEVKKNMIIEGLKALKTEQEVVIKQQPSIFKQFFVPTVKDERGEEKNAWWITAVVVIVGIGLLSSMMAQTKNTFGLIDGWAVGDKLPDLKEYDPMDIEGEKAGVIIFAFLFFFLAAPASRFIFSCFAVGNLSTLTSALYEACTYEALKKEVTTYKMNYAVGAALALGVLGVFIYSLHHPVWQEPFTSGEHGWKTGEYSGMLTPTGIAILGACAVWLMFKWFEPKVDKDKAPKDLLTVTADSEKRSGLQMTAAVVNALSFGAIGGGGMIFFLVDVLHCPNDTSLAENLILIASILTMVTLGVSSLGTSMQPVRLRGVKDSLARKDSYNDLQDSDNSSNNVSKSSSVKLI